MRKPHVIVLALLKHINRASKSKSAKNRNRRPLMTKVNKDLYNELDSSYPTEDEDSEVQGDDAHLETHES
ncbi:hypothetical protein OROMI_032844 [Orobanche minor]